MRLKVSSAKRRPFHLGVNVSMNRFRSRRIQTVDRTKVDFIWRFATTNIRINTYINWKGDVILKTFSSLILDILVELYSLCEGGYIGHWWIPLIKIDLVMWTFNVFTVLFWTSCWTNNTVVNYLKCNCAYWRHFDFCYSVPDKQIVPNWAHINIMR